MSLFQFLTLYYDDQRDNMPILVSDEDPLRSFISKTHIRLLNVEDLPKLCHSLREIAMFGKFAHFLV